ncbi:MAG: hypothetical protein ACTSVI_04900 [Promethearchaeota archaeon]
MDRLVSFFKGNINTRSLRVYFLANFLVFMMLLLIAMQFFPGGYTFFDWSVSALGNWDVNPSPGWIFFSIAFWFESVSFWPFYMYMLKKIKKHSSKLSALNFVIFCVISVGMGLLGFFSESKGTFLIHAVAALMIFGGYFFSVNLLTIMLFNFPHFKSHPQWRRFRPLMLGIFIIFWAVIISISLVILLKHSELYNAFPAFFNINFWEWIYVSCISVYLLSLEIIFTRISP